MDGYATQAMGADSLGAGDLERIYRSLRLIRRAEEEVARYVQHHWYEFPPQIRDELVNRGMDS